MVLKEDKPFRTDSAKKKERWQGNTDAKQKRWAYLRYLSLSKEEDSTGRFFYRE
jgi:hypothetical protein